MMPNDTVMHEYFGGNQEFSNINYNEDLMYEYFDDGLANGHLLEEYSNIINISQSNCDRLKRKYDRNKKKTTYAKWKECEKAIADREGRKKAKKDYRVDKYKAKLEWKADGRKGGREAYKDTKHKLKEKKIELMEKHGVHWTRTAIRKFRTVTLIPFRAGTIAAARINLFGMSLRMYPAFLTEKELKEQRFSAENAKKARQAWIRTQFFWKDLGGNPDELKSAMKKGAKKMAKKLADLKEFQGRSSFLGEDGIEPYHYEGDSGEVNLLNHSYDGGVTEGIIIAALGVITSVISLIAQSGASKNPYEQGKSPAGFNTDNMNLNDLPSLAEEIQDQIDVTKSNPYLSEGQKSIAIELIQTGMVVDATEAAEKAAEQTKSGIGTWEWVGIIGGVMIVGGIAIYLVIKNKKK